MQLRILKVLNQLDSQARQLDELLEVEARYS